jgi:hypothetical protein
MQLIFLIFAGHQALLPFRPEEKGFGRRGPRGVPRSVGDSEYITGPLWTRQIRRLCALPQRGRRVRRRRLIPPRGT